CRRSAERRAAAAKVGRDRAGLVLLVEAGVELHDAVDVQRETAVAGREQRLARGEGDIDARAGLRLVDRVLHRRDLGLLLLLGLGDLRDLLLLGRLLLLSGRRLLLRRAQLGYRAGQVLDLGLQRADPRIARIRTMRMLGGGSRRG